MKIHLGLSDVLRPQMDTLGEHYVSTARFLHILELYLGLTPKLASRAERVTSYLNALREANVTYFNASVCVDPLTTAGHLLALRDALWLQGWDGRELDGSARLVAISAVERACSDLPQNEAQRLLAIADCLAQGAKLPFESIVLQEPLAFFPKRWRDILSSFDCTERSYEPQGESGTNLHRLQQIMLNGTGETPCRLEPAQDDSIQVYQAGSMLLANQLLGALRQSQSSSETLMVTGETDALEYALANLDQPSQGLNAYSTDRPALQLLPLSLALLWQPMDVWALLDFLTNPFCPLPRKLRQRLAKAVAKEPGMHGKAWVDAWEEGCKQDGEQAATIEENARFWLEQQRYERSAGIPAKDLVARVTAVRDHLQFCQGRCDAVVPSSLAAARQQAEDVLAGLRQLTAEQEQHAVSPRELQQLLAQAGAGWTASPVFVSQVGAITTLDDPASAAGGFDAVIWGPLHAPDSVTHSPWSAAECSALARHDVTWPLLQDQLQWFTTRWLRPVLAARQQLILLLPAAGTEVHPAWLMIKSVLEAGNQKWPVISAESRIYPGLWPQTEPQPCIPLPRPRRWWRVSSDLLGATCEVNSYSSLNVQIMAPYQWALKYQARLYASNLQTLPDVVTLNGLLSHRLVELLFEQNQGAVPVMDEAQVSSWLDGGVFQRVLEQQGALLLQPGARQWREGLRRTLVRAISRLLAEIHRRGVRSVESEKLLTGIFAGGKLEGRADLLLHSRDAEPVVLDMKWSGIDKYRDKLQKGNAAQLALYGELYRQQQGRWLMPAYYIFASASLLDRAGQSPAQTWQAFLKTWQWRQSQLKQGQIEVVCAQTADSSDDSTLPEDALKPDQPNENYNNFCNLVGWEVYA